MQRNPLVIHRVLPVRALPVQLWAAWAAGLPFVVQGCAHRAVRFEDQPEHVHHSEPPVHDGYHGPATVSFCLSDDGAVVVSRWRYFGSSGGVDDWVSVSDVSTGKSVPWESPQPNTLLWELITKTPRRHYVVDTGLLWARKWPSGTAARRKLLPFVRTATGALPLGDWNMEPSTGALVSTTGGLGAPVRIWHWVGGSAEGKDPRDGKGWEARVLDDSEEGNSYSPQFIRNGEFLITAGHWAAIRVWRTGATRPLACVGPDVMNWGTYGVSCSGTWLAYCLSDETWIVDLGPAFAARQRRQQLVLKPQIRVS
jgi:hypothetical protein